MTWLDDLAAMLEGESLGTRGVTLFIFRAPEDPHNLTALIPYGGLAPQRTHNGTERRFPRLQVYTRDRRAELAYEHAEDIREFFRTIPQVQVGSTVYEAILPLGEPLVLTRDTQGRYPYIVNYEVRFHGSQPALYGRRSDDKPANPRAGPPVRSQAASGGGG